MEWIDATKSPDAWNYYILYFLLCRGVNTIAVNSMELCLSPTMRSSLSRRSWSCSFDKISFSFSARSGMQLLRASQSSSHTLCAHWIAKTSVWEIWLTKAYAKSFSLWQLVRISSCDCFKAASFSNIEFAAVRLAILLQRHCSREPFKIEAEIAMHSALECLRFSLAADIDLASSSSSDSLSAI